MVDQAIATSDLTPAVPEVETLIMTQTELDNMPEFSGVAPSPRVMGIDKKWRAMSRTGEWFVCEYYRNPGDQNVCWMRFWKVDLQAGEVMEKIGRAVDGNSGADTENQRRRR